MAVEYEYVIIGGDARFGYLARLLRREGCAVAAMGNAAPDVPAAGVEALKNARNAVVNIPLRVRGAALSLAEIDRRLPEGARILACGPEAPATTLGGRIVDLWADEALKTENAALTAEGAVCAAMRASVDALRGMRCMVVGWGRIGRALTELLVGMGARVTVASRSDAKRNRAVERGAEAVPTALLAGALPGHRLVFNTAQERVLDASTLRRADADAMLIDLAGPPYGIDLNAAWRLGLRAWREPALPGRYCPQSAARALLRAIERSGAKGGGRDV